MSPLTFLRHRLLYWTRHPSHGGGTAAGQVVVVFLLLLVMTLFVYGPFAAVGWFLPNIVSEVQPAATPLDVASEWFLWTFVTLIPIRFFLHSPTQNATAAYLTLSLQNRTLVHTRLALELMSLHTLTPLALGIPVLIRVVAPALSVMETIAWTVCLLAPTVAYSYAGVYLNEALGRRSRLFWSIMGTSAVLFTADWVAPFDVFLPLSSAIMARPLLAMPLLVSTAMLVYAVLFRLRMTAYTRHTDAGHGDAPLGLVSDAITWIGAQGDAGKATALELYLIVRHRRTRGLCMLLLVMGPAMCYFSALTGKLSSLFIAIQYVSMGFAILYGYILFSADHRHLEGMLARTSNPELLVRGKVQAMQIMNALLFVLMCPALLLLPTRDALFMCAWIPFGLFVYAPLSVYFAASTKTPVDLSVSAFMPGASGFHMLPLVVPAFGVLGIVLLYAEISHWSVAALPAVISACGAGMMPALRRATARKLERRKYRLLHSFRSTDPT